jgi:hypothetical protein
MLKPIIKENWLISVISGAVGSIITLLAILCIHETPNLDFKDILELVIQLIAAIGTVGAVIVSLCLSNMQSKKEKRSELKSDVDAMIKHLEIFIMDLVALDLELKQSVYSEINKTSDEVDNDHRTKLLYNDFDKAMNDCKNWLSIQKTDNEKIDEKIQELIDNLDGVFRGSVVAPFQQFTKDVRQVLADIT